MSILAELNVPVFTAGGRPEIDHENYTLTVRGLDGAESSFSLAEVRAWSWSVVDARLTSVSGWSVRADWGGILWRDFIKMFPPSPRADHATFVSLGGGYDTTVSLKDLDHPRVLLALEVNGEPIETPYGGPLRMIVPNLYGYKSAKWLAEISFREAMTGGYWEDRGYTRSGIIEPGSTLDFNTRERRRIKGGEVTEF